MPTLILDTIDSAELVVDASGKQLTRTGIIYGMPTGDDYKLLFDANDPAIIPNMPLNGSALDAGTNANLILQTKKLQPLGPSVVGVQLQYRTPSLDGGPLSSWVIRDDSRLSSVRVNKVPGLNQIIKVGFDGTIKGRRISVLEQTADMDMELPIRELSAVATVLGTPATNPNTLVGSVNSSTFYGLPTAYWKLVEGGTERNVYQGYSIVFATLQTRVLTDWSEYLFAVDPKTGDAAYDESQLPAISALAYVRGVMNPSGASGCNTCGICRVGPYPTANFATTLTF